MSANPAEPVPAYVLAGGLSSRFGSDKARAEVDGEPLITRVTRQLAVVCHPLIAVADAPGRYAGLGVATIGDEQPGLGPKGGLVTALAHRAATLGPGWLLLASCDLLDATGRWTRPLLDASRRGLAIAYRHDRWEPMPALYHTAVEPLARQQLNRGDGAMWRLLDAAGAAQVGCPHGFNRVPQANRPGDLPHA